VVCQLRTPNLENTIQKWKTNLDDDFIMEEMRINCLLLADDQVITANSEEHLQKAVHKFYQ
jgi:hypothetical protein